MVIWCVAATIHVEECGSWVFGKVAPHFYGPFPILEEVDKVDCRLQLPPTTNIHPIFHVSQLKLAKGTNFKSCPLLD